MYRVITPVAALYKDARPENMISQLLYGEVVELVDSTDNWRLIRNHRDDYQGYVEAIHLQPHEPLPDSAYRWVNRTATHLYSAADMKSVTVSRLTYAACVAVEPQTEGPFVKTVSGHYLWQEHLTDNLQQPAVDMVVHAQRLFSGTPYLWGGRSTDGVDCSGMVQLSALALGIMLPRDSGPQKDYLQRSECHQSIAHEQRRRADLVYWPGHVGMLINRQTLFHATAFSLQCCVEPLAAVIARAGEPEAIFRLVTEN